MSILGHLEPNSVFRFFEEMCAIMMRYYKINPLIDKEKAKEFKEELTKYMGKINQDKNPNISFEEFLKLFDVRYL